MKITLNIFASAALLAIMLVSCSPKIAKSKEISCTELLRMRDTHTLNHTVYSGSDEQFHYFTHHSLDKSRNGAYKVRRGELDIPNEYPLGEQAPDLFIPLPNGDGGALIALHGQLGSEASTTNGESPMTDGDATTTGGEPQPTAEDYEMLKSYFPDIQPGKELPYADARLLPMDGLAYSWYNNPAEVLAESGDREEVHAIGRMLGYKGCDLFVISHLMERADEDTYDNHGGPVEYLILFRDGVPVTHDDLPGKVLGSSYYGEGGTADMTSVFNRDTTLTTTWHISEQESATGYQTPIVAEYARRWSITLPGETPQLDTLLYVRYSSPYFDADFVSEREGDWRQYDYRHYPTADDKWQLDWRNNELGDTYLYFYIADIDGALRTVFETRRADAATPTDSYVLGQLNEPRTAALTEPTALTEPAAPTKPGESAKPAAPAQSGESGKRAESAKIGTGGGSETGRQTEINPGIVVSVTLDTSDGTIALMPDGRFVLPAATSARR